MIKRKLLSEIRNHLSKKEMSVIIGPRQAGKTTLMLILKDELDKADKNTLMLNFDIESDRQFLSSQSALIQKIKLEFGKDEGIVFIDEIQRKENAGLFLKGLYDMNLPYKFILSGSGSIELKEKIHESLAGRKRVFELTTLSFEEYVNFKTNYAYEDKLDKFFEIETVKTEEYFTNYLTFGGYPNVVLEETFEGKQAILNEIYQSYIEKDIAYLLKITKTEDFSHLIKIIASQIGQVVNISELSRTLRIAQATVRNYLWYMEKTFILNKVTPFFKNTRKEITKSPMYYFNDVGLRNHSLNILGNIQDSSDVGFLFQNFVHQLLHKKVRGTSANINFWRTKYGAEVDFIIDSNKSPIAFEVKYQKLQNASIPRSMRSFIETYKPKKVFIINLTFRHETTINGTKVHFIPYTDLLLSVTQDYFPTSASE